MGVTAGLRKGMSRGVSWWKRREAPARGEGTETLGNQLAALKGPAALAAKLAEESSRERLPQEPTALLLIGLDDAQQLSQSEGCAAAQLVQLTVARAFGAALPRRADLLARLDESTFAAVLPGTDLPGALRVAARLRWAVLRLGIPHPSRETVTVSFGLAVECGAITQEGARLVGTARALLRQAQSAGGDRTQHEVLDGPEELGPMPPMRSIRAGAVMGVAELGSR
jgi:diguanylate cyclase (GGDEF)-like protein